MYNSFILVIAVAAGLLFSSCKKIKGEGPVLTETRTITGFTGVSADVDGDVYITPDSVYKVEIRAQQNILDVIQSPVVNGELRIRYKNDVIVGRHDRIAVYISAPNISSFSVSGSGKLIVQRPVKTDLVQLWVSGSGFMNIPSITARTLTCNISGSGSIAVNSGITDDQSLEISGSGDIDMTGLSAKISNIHINGSGSARINVTEMLNADISGSGNIYYTGFPQVNTHISGSGRVIHL